MADEGVAEIEARLAAGEWLRPGQVATLFGKSRWAVDGWLRSGARMANGERYFIAYRESPGGWRELDPEDVRKVLADYRTRRTGQRPPAAPAEESQGPES